MDRIDEQPADRWLVWAVKILTDPLHDIKLYYKAPLRLMRGEFDGRVVLGHSH